MIKIVRAILTAIFALLLLTTSITAQKSKAPVRDYFPLRVGDSWKYQSTVSDAVYTVKVLSAEKQSDGTILYLLEKLGGVKIHDWYSKTSGWVFLNREAYPDHEGMQIKYEPARQFLRNPLAAGTTWKWSGKSIIQSDAQESNEVGGPELVVVAAGKFLAMKIVSKVSDGASAMTKTYWYADGIGLVKSMTKAGETEYGFELVDYSFKKGRPKK